MNFSDEATRVRAARSALQVDLGQIDILKKQVDEKELLLQKTKEDVETYDKAAMLLNRLGEERQAEAQEMIEGLVTRGLQAIFEPNISLVISTSVKGKSTTTEFLVRTELENGEFFETSVMDARGGGLVAVVAFLLRVTMLLLTQPEGRRVMFIDESFAMVSAEFLEGVGTFLKDLVDETGLQVILVTHQEDLAEFGTSSARFSQKDGRTSVTLQA